MNCPYCKSNKVVKGSDFYVCNNPHCLRIWLKKDNLKDKNNPKDKKIKSNRRKK